MAHPEFAGGTVLRRGSRSMASGPRIASIGTSDVKSAGLAHSDQGESGGAQSSKSSRAFMDGSGGWGCGQGSGCGEERRAVLCLLVDEGLARGTGVDAGGAAVNDEDAQGWVDGA